MHVIIWYYLGKKYVYISMDIKINTYLNSIPSVKYLMRVFLVVLSSKRIEYPTSEPNSTPNSSATLFQTTSIVINRIERKK